MSGLINTGGSCSVYHDSLYHLPQGQYGYSGHVVKWYYVTINFHLADFYIKITFYPSVTMACTKIVPYTAPPILVGKGIAAYPICICF